MPLRCPQGPARRCSLAPAAGPAGGGRAGRYRPAAGRGRGARPGRRRREAARARERRRRCVAELSAATGWPVMASPLSGCRLPGAIGAADALLRSPVVQGWQPDVVVRLGAPWASRVVNEWLAALFVHPGPCRPLGRLGRSRPRPRRSRGHQPCGVVPGSCQGGQRAGRGAWGLGAPIGLAGGPLAESAAQEAIDAALAREADLTEPGIARTLVDAVPAGGTMVVASSMPIRDVEWWGRPRGGRHGGGQPGCQRHRRGAVDGTRFCNVARTPGPSPRCSATLLSFTTPGHFWRLPARVPTSTWSLSTTTEVGFSISYRRRALSRRRASSACGARRTGLTWLP